jgi:hypothetical protein
MSSWKVVVLYDPAAGPQRELTVVSGQSLEQARRVARHDICALGWAFEDCYSDDCDEFQPLGE